MEGQSIGLVLLQFPCVVTNLVYFIYIGQQLVLQFLQLLSDLVQHLWILDHLYVKFQGQVYHLFCRLHASSKSETNLISMSSDERQMWISAPSCSLWLHVHLSFSTAGQADFGPAPDTEARAIQKLYSSHYFIRSILSIKSFILLTVVLPLRMQSVPEWYQFNDTSLLGGINKIMYVKHLVQCLEHI